MPTNSNKISSEIPKVHWQHLFAHYLSNLQLTNSVSRLNSSDSRPSTIASRLSFLRYQIALQSSLQRFSLIEESLTSCPKT
jgi:hypothetical protein